MVHGRSSRIVAIVAVLGGLAVGAGRAAADMRIAVVDMQRALNDCDAGKKAKDQVKARMEKADADLKRQQEDLDRRKDEYERKALVLKEEERRNLEKDLESRSLEFKRKLEDARRDFARSDSELSNAIIKDLKDLVLQYGEKNNYTLVFEASSGLLFADKAVDVTDEIIKLYNASPKKSAKVE
jgi:outer membrane protein